MTNTINFLTERERQLEDIDQAIRETKYPPLNGGPTTEDLVGLLEGAAATIEELDDSVAELEDNAERCDELQEVIEDAVNELEDVIIELECMKETGNFKDIDATITQLRCTRSNLRRT